MLASDEGMKACEILWYSSMCALAFGSCAGPVWTKLRICIGEHVFRWSRCGSRHTQAPEEQELKIP